MTSVALDAVRPEDAVGGSRGRRRSRCRMTLPCERLLDGADAVVHLAANAG